MNDNKINDIEQYRIDYAYETIYIYDADVKAYLFYCSFAALGVTRKNRESTILKKLTNQIEF